VRALIREAWYTARASRLTTVSSTLAMALSLGVLGLVGLLAGGTQQAAQAAQEWIDLEVYLADSVTVHRAGELRRDLVKTPGVQNAVHVTKIAAVERYSEFADTAALAVLSANPLPASFIVTLEDDHKTPDQVRALIASIERWPGVYAVDADLVWIETLHMVVLGTGAATALFVAAIGLAVTYVIWHTIGLGAAARRTVIEMMRHLGAPLGFIRRPFVLVGVLQGLAAWGMACAMVFAAAHACRQIPIIGGGITEPVVNLVYLGLLLVGIILSWAGSRLALRTAIPADPWILALEKRGRVRR